ncbi:MAG TPA: STAS domain-containing protein [Polyangiaceae bacterium]|nr:STAS domain-containing protein [Polyangiaceae bacterium]
MNCLRVDDAGCVTLKIRGELDALSAPELRPVLDQLVEDEARDVIVDLSELRMVDSSGVGALVSLYKRVRSYGGQLAFMGVTAQPLVIFKLLRLDVVFGLAQDLPGTELEEAAPASIRVLRT